MIKPKRITKAKQKKKDRATYNKALALWLEDVRLIADYKCEMCGKQYTKGDHGLHSHHIIPRQIKELSLDLNNGIALCFSCHKVGKWAVHQNAIHFTLWLKEFRPDKYAYLIQKLADLVRHKNKKARI